jgi:hypothetical protein
MEKVTLDTIIQQTGFNQNPMGPQPDLIHQLRNIMTMEVGFISVDTAFLNVLFIKAIFFQ